MRLITLRADRAESRDDLVMRWILTILVATAGCADDRCPQGLVARGLGVCHVPDEVAGHGDDERPVPRVEWSQAGMVAAIGRDGGGVTNGADRGGGGGRSGIGGRDGSSDGGTGGSGPGGLRDESTDAGVGDSGGGFSGGGRAGTGDPLPDGGAGGRPAGGGEGGRGDSVGRGGYGSVAPPALQAGQIADPASAGTIATPQVARCGDGHVDPGELCDGDCPVTCDDADLCTKDSMTGSAAACSIVCSHTQVTSGTSCGTGKVCDANARCVDVQLCGNGKLDPGEYCDDSSSSLCPSCTGSNPCVTYSAHGSATDCSLRCDSQPKPAGTSCGGSNICKASGTCGAPSALYQDCTVTADCGRDLVCLDGQCSVRCASASSSCPPRSGASATCRSFHSESQGVCRLDCQQDSTCGAGWRCSGTGMNGFCVPADVPGAN